MKNLTANKTITAAHLVIRNLKRFFFALCFISPTLSLQLHAAPDTNRQQELAYLLKQDCGSCHGLRLKGGLGPPLLAENIKGKPNAYLKQVISQGIPGSAMPPWGKLLSEQDIDYLVQLLSTESIMRQNNPSVKNSNETKPK